MENAIAPIHHTPDYVVLSYDEIPDRWSRLMSSFVGQPTLDEAIDSLPCFPLVLKSWSIWLVRLTSEATQLLNAPQVSDINAKLTSIEEALENDLHLPYIFIGQDVLTTGKLLMKHKLTVLKLNVGLQGLQEKREQVRDQLDLLQATKHEFSSAEELHELFSGAGKLNYDDRTLLDLCTCLYRIHMQYVMCLELYLNYVEKIIMTAHTTKKVSTMKWSHLEQEIVSLYGLILCSNIKE